MAQKRTTTRSRAGAKLYVKRSKIGQFTDIQTYKRAHGSDVKRRAKAEAARRGTKSQGTKRGEDAAAAPARVAREVEAESLPLVRLGLQCEAADADRRGDHAGRHRGEARRDGGPAPASGVSIRPCAPPRSRRKDVAREAPGHRADRAIGVGDQLGPPRRAQPRGNEYCRHPDLRTVGALGISPPTSTGAESVGTANA
jgi:hypothetical protein